MFALVVAIVATIVLMPEALAQQQYTVLSSIVLTRTGDRTPQYYGDLPTTLTTLGATQAYNQGQYFRSRYLTSSATSNGVGGAPLSGLTADFLDVNDLYVLSLDQQWNLATAQAFIQGLYPPYSPETANSPISALQNPTGILANGSYIDSPLGGYQYPQIHAANGYDPDFLYLSANLDCPAFNGAANEYIGSSEATTMQSDTLSIYESIGSAMLNGVVNTTDWNYAHAYPFFEYLNYQNSHNMTAASELNGFHSTQANVSDLSILQWLADEQQYAELGNLTASPALPDDLSGSISTIAGNMLAALILEQFSEAIVIGQLSSIPSVVPITPSSNFNPTKLTLLFADYHPFTSFFALADLPRVDAAFTGLPQFGASAVFELFTYANQTVNAPFPASTDDLWVRFYFRNGTDPDSTPYQSFPLFGNSPSNTDLSWATFQSGLGAFALHDIGDWCSVCQATNVFCAAWDPSSVAAAEAAAARGNVAPVVAGVIGAIVGLVIAGLAFAGVMLCAGVRVHRVARRQQQRTSGFGGFKGRQKMRSDQDLTIPKGGAVVGATVEEVGPMSPGIGHERIGSWELKQSDAERSAAPEILRVPSLEEDRDLDAYSTPVKPLERV